MSLSSLKTDIDKAGNTCQVIDVCINTTLYNALKNEKYKQFVIELACSFISQRHSLELSELTLLNMKSKGDLSLHNIKYHELTQAKKSHH